jgi:hypothetical protein
MGGEEGGKEWSCPCPCGAVPAMAAKWPGWTNPNEPNGPCPTYQNPNPYTSFDNIKIGPHWLYPYLMKKQKYYTSLFQLDLSP